MHYFQRFAENDKARKQVHCCWHVERKLRMSVIVIDEQVSVQFLTG